jgi:hypothetical protein
MSSKSRREEALFAKRIEELCNKISTLDKADPQAAALMQELEQVLEQFRLFRKTHKLNHPF